MIEAVRKAALGGATLSDLTPEITAILGFGVFWLAAGYLLFNWMERRARRSGALGQY